MNKPTQAIPLNTMPTGVEVSVVDEEGVTVFDGVTPTTVTLTKGAGYFKSKHYTMTLRKQGYADVVLPITGRVSGWYVAGNLVFGGLIGWLVVDPLSGAMYTFEPKDVNMSLQQSVALLNEKGDSIPVVMLQDVPVHLRGKMMPVMAN